MYSSGNGKYIAFEGLEGCGKTTLTRWLVDCLSQHLTFQPLMVREPGSTPLGEAIRSLLLYPKNQDTQIEVDPIPEMLLFHAARLQMQSQCITPQLQKGLWVVSDRCALSSWAYQGYGRGIELEKLKKLSALWSGEHPYPDITFYLYLTARHSRQRCLERKGAIDRIEALPLSFFEKVYAGYESCYSQFPNVVKIDASESLHHVQGVIFSHVQRLFLDS